MRSIAGLRSSFWLIILPMLMLVVLRILRTLSVLWGAHVVILHGHVRVMKSFSRLRSIHGILLLITKLRHIFIYKQILRHINIILFRLLLGGALNRLLNRILHRLLGRALNRLLNGTLNWLLLTGMLY